MSRPRATRPIAPGEDPVVFVWRPALMTSSGTVVEEIVDCSRIISTVLIDIVVSTWATNTIGMET